MDLTGGVRVPYFMKSGLADNERHLARSTAKLFGIRSDQKISSISSFKKIGQFKRSSTRLQVARFLYGNADAKKKRIFRYDDRFFWIMGDREGVPDDLYDTFRTVRTHHRKFGKKMKLLNFESEEHGTSVQGELDDAGQSSLLITSKIIRNVEGSSQGSRPTPKGYEFPGRRLSPGEFEAYVEGKIAEKWPESSMEVSINLSSLPEKLDELPASSSLTDGNAGAGTLGPDRLGGAGPGPPAPDRVSLPELPYSEPTTNPELPEWDDVGYR